MATAAAQEERKEGDCNLGHTGSRKEKREPEEENMPLVKIFVKEAREGAKIDEERVLLSIHTLVEEGCGEGEGIF